jgi:hypothetical protein
MEDRMVLTRITNSLTRRIMGSFLRHVSTFLAGALVVIGLDPEWAQAFTGQLEVVIAAIIAYALAQGASIKKL